MIYSEIVACRRALRIDGYKTLGEVGFEGPWVTPYQMSACAPDGPVLVAYHWLDAPSVEQHRDTLKRHGYLPAIAFNQVLDRALKSCGIARRDIYVTQAFHLLPATERSAGIPARHIDISFDAVTRHELAGRPVIALGDAAAGACRRHGVRHQTVCHPSARGLSYQAKAVQIADAIRAAMSTPGS